MNHKQALKHFEQTDLIMANVLSNALKSDKLLHQPTPASKQQYFSKLVGSIVSQQLSTKAADTIWNRFEQLVGDVTPLSILRFNPEEFRQVGLSYAKANYILSIAESIRNKQIKIDDLDNLDDEDVIARLIKLKGIGNWSAEMFLIFTLARADVFSSGDLGLLRSIETHYGRSGITPAQIDEMALVWSPHRTSAALALWHARDN